jgi:hypothetical protein
MLFVSGSLAIAKRGSLVSQHLELVSGALFESHHAILRRFAKGQPGVYALYKAREGKEPRLYYVGLASDLTGRLKQHLKDRHRKRWNRFSLYLVRATHHIKELEALLLRIAYPIGNTQRGRFVQCEDLRRPLARAIKREHYERQCELLGVDQVRRGRTRRTDAVRKRATKKQGALVPYLSLFRRRRLRATYKGRTYKARILRDGRISVGGRRSWSPSDAGGQIVNRACNGWHFWHYERGPDNWVRLQEIRR